MNIVEDKQYLRSQEDIETYFDDHELFDCGQGYYEDEVIINCKIGEQYFRVAVTADIESFKMDRGDRMYSVDCIHTPTWEEVAKNEVMAEMRIVLAEQVQRAKADVVAAKAALAAFDNGV